MGGTALVGLVSQNDRQGAAREPLQGTPQEVGRSVTTQESFREELENYLIIRTSGCIPPDRSQIGASEDDTQSYSSCRPLT